MSNHIAPAKPRYRVTVQFHGDVEVEVEAPNEKQAVQEVYKKICNSLFQPPSGMKLTGRSQERIV
jgi:hypothetical protein